MADTEKDMLFMGVGFFSALYLMTHFVSLRPAGAKSLNMTSMNNEIQPIDMI